MSMFSVGQMVVWPGQGVCKVIRIESKVHGNSVKETYIVTSQNGMTFMCPVSDNNLRPISSFGVIREAIAMAKQGEVKIDRTTWNKRYREYLELIKTGDLMNIATVYRSLTLLGDEKDLSFGERKMIDLTRDLLTHEIEACEGIELVVL